MTAFFPSVKGSSADSSLIARSQQKCTDLYVKRFKLSQLNCPIARLTKLGNKSLLQVF